MTPVDFAVSRKSAENMMILCSFLCAQFQVEIADFTCICRGRATAQIPPNSLAFLHTLGVGPLISTHFGSKKKGPDLAWQQPCEPGAHLRSKKGGVLAPDWNLRPL